MNLFTRSLFLTWIHQLATKPFQNQLLLCYFFHQAIGFLKQMKNDTIVINWNHYVTNAQFKQQAKPNQYYCTLFHHKNVTWFQITMAANSYLFIKTHFQMNAKKNTSGNKSKSENKFICQKSDFIYVLLYYCFYAMSLRIDDVCWSLKNVLLENA